MLPPLTLVSLAPKSWHSNRPELTLTAFSTLVLESLKQLFLRNSQMMLTAFLICSKNFSLGWRKSLMNVSSKWLGVMKSDVG